MMKFIGVGALCGAVIIGINTLLITLGYPSAILGFAVIFLVFSAIYFVVRSHRDEVLGGTISFASALGKGALMALAATVVYVLIWELYQMSVDYAFYGDYVDGLVAAEQLAGTTGDAFNAFLEEMNTLKTNLANPFFRLPMTAMEILPAGLLVSLITAALVKK